MELFKQLNEQGTTIVQVTHSEANAAFGNRVIEVRDGWMTMDTANPDLAKGVAAGTNVAPEVGAS
jgi:ABC-type lipoprotein export system ATPase subunit